MKRKIILPEIYKLGFENWDSQHGELIALLQDLLECSREKENREGLEEIFEALLKYSRNHFAYEEAKMRKIGYKGLEDHLNEHKLFREKIHMLYQEKVSDIKIEQTIIFLRNWCYSHILIVDRELSNTIHALHEGSDLPRMKSKKVC